MSWMLLSALEVYGINSVTNTVHIPMSDLTVDMFEEVYSADLIDNQINTVYMQKDEFVIVLIEEQ